MRYRTRIIRMKNFLPYQASQPRVIIYDADQCILILLPIDLASHGRSAVLQGTYQMPVMLYDAQSAAISTFTSARPTASDLPIFYFGVSTNSYSPIAGLDFKYFPLSP